jgi:hypothetical protein
VTTAKYGYELEPVTVRELLYSALGQAEAKRTDPEFDPRRDGVVLTPEAIVDLCHQVLPGAEL